MAELDASSHGPAHWHFRLELPAGRGHVERHLLPARAPRPRGFDELAFYAERFNTVEINSTFYGQPRAQRAPSAGSSGRRPGSSSRSSSIRSSRIPRCSRGRASKRRTPTPAARDADRHDQADVDQFKARHRAARPRADARGAARPVSAQLQGRAARRATTCDWLLRDVRRLSGRRRAAPQQLERRRLDETAQLLHAYGAAWMQIDEPKFRFSIRQDLLPNVTTFYYMRLHGRNAAQWWAARAVRGSLQLLYTEEELRPIAEAARHRPCAGEEAVPVHEQPLRGAGGRQRRRCCATLLDDPVDAPMPAELVERYPMLRPAEGR